MLFKHKIYNCNVTITFSREKPEVINEISIKPAFSPEKKCRAVLLPLFSLMESQLRARMSRVSFTSWKSPLRGALQCLPTTSEPKEIALERLSHTHSSTRLSHWLLPSQKS